MDKNTCPFLSDSGASVFSISRKSTQNDVVSEVKALSAELYAAAISPITKTIPTKEKDVAMR